MPCPTCGRSPAILCPCPRPLRQSVTYMSEWDYQDVLAWMGTAADGVNAPEKPGRSFWEILRDEP